MSLNTKKQAVTAKKKQEDIPDMKGLSADKFKFTESKRENELDNIVVKTEEKKKEAPKTEASPAPVQEPEKKESKQTKKTSKRLGRTPYSELGKEVREKITITIKPELKRDIEKYIETHPNEDGDPIALSTFINRACIHYLNSLK